MTLAFRKYRLPEEDLNIPIRLRVTTSRNSCAQIR